MPPLRMSNKGMGHGPKGRGPRPKIDKATLPTILKWLLKSYKWRILLVLVFVAIASIATASTGIFLEKVITAISNKDYNALLSVIYLMVTIFVLATISNVAKGFIMATVTQGFLNDLRVKMFDKMQSFPIKYSPRR